MHLLPRCGGGSVKTTNMTKTAAIYARISSDPEHQLKGVDRQLKDCREAAESKGWVIHDTYVDNDISAYSGVERPEYNRLKEDIEAGKIDVVITWTTDRLFRKPRELEDWILFSEEKNVFIHSSSSDSELNLSSLQSVVMARVITTFASYEVGMTKMRIKRKHLELAQSGAWPNARVYGYLANAEIVPAEAEIIREMAERYLSGEQINGIARDLNARGVPTLKNANWRAATIVNILRAPRIAGLRVHNGEIAAKGAWDPIIDEDLSHILRARLTPGRSPVPRGGPRKHLLVGILVCGRCRTGMVRGLGGKQKTPNYRCPKNVGATACGRMTIVADKAEDFIFQAACSALDLAVQGDEPEVENNYSARLLEIEAKKEEIMADFVAGLIDRKLYLGGLEGLRAQAAALEPPKTKKRAAMTTGNHLREEWPNMAVSAQRAILESIFAKVTINGVIITTGAKRFDPRRFDFEWRV